MTDGFCTCYDGEPLINQTCGIANHREAARSALQGPRQRWVCGLPLATGGEVPTQAMVDRLTRERDEARAALARVEALLSDEHDPFVHYGHTTNETDSDCGACWDHEIRAALQGTE